MLFLEPIFYFNFLNVFCASANPDKKGGCRIGSRSYKRNISKTEKHRKLNKNFNKRASDQRIVLKEQLDYKNARKRIHGANNQGQTYNVRSKSMNEDSAETIYNSEDTQMNFKIQTFYETHTKHYIFQYGPFIYVFDLKKPGTINERLLVHAMYDFRKFCENKPYLDFNFDAYSMHDASFELNNVCMMFKDNFYLWRNSNPIKLKMKRKYKFLKWFVFFNKDTSILLLKPVVNGGITSTHPITHKTLANTLDNGQAEKSQHKTFSLNKKANEHHSKSNRKQKTKIKPETEVYEYDLRSDFKPQKLGSKKDGDKNRKKDSMLSDNDQKIAHEQSRSRINKNSKTNTDNIRSLKSFPSKDVKQIDHNLEKQGNKMQKFSPENENSTKSESSKILRSADKKTEAKKVTEDTANEQFIPCAQRCTLKHCEKIPIDQSIKDQVSAHLNIEKYIESTIYQNKFSSLKLPEVNQMSNANILICKKNIKKLCYIIDNFLVDLAEMKIIELDSYRIRSITNGKQQLTEAFQKYSLNPTEIQYQIALKNQKLLYFFVYDLVESEVISNFIKFQSKFTPDGFWFSYSLLKDEEIKNLSDVEYQKFFKTENIESNKKYFDERKEFENKIHQDSQSLDDQSFLSIYSEIFDKKPEKLLKYEAPLKNIVFEAYLPMIQPVKEDQIVPNSFNSEKKYKPKNHIEQAVDTFLESKDVEIIDSVALELEKSEKIILFSENKINSKSLSYSIVISCLQKIFYLTESKEIRPEIDLELKNTYYAKGSMILDEKTKMNAEYFVTDKYTEFLFSDENHKIVVKLTNIKNGIQVIYQKISTNEFKQGSFKIEFVTKKKSKNNKRDLSRQEAKKDFSFTNISDLEVVQTPWMSDDPLSRHPELKENKMGTSSDLIIKTEGKIMVHRKEPCTDLCIHLLNSFFEDLSSDKEEQKEDLNENTKNISESSIDLKQKYKHNTKGLKNLHSHLSAINKKILPYDSRLISLETFKTNNEKIIHDTSNKIDNAISKNTVLETKMKNLENLKEEQIPKMEEKLKNTIEELKKLYSSNAGFTIMYEKIQKIKHTDPKAIENILRALLEGFKGFNKASKGSTQSDSKNTTYSKLNEITKSSYKNFIREISKDETLKEKLLENLQDVSKNLFEEYNKDVLDEKNLLDKFLAEILGDKPIEDANKIFITTLLKDSTEFKTNEYECCDTKIAEKQKFFIELVSIESSLIKSYNSYINKEFECSKCKSTKKEKEFLSTYPSYFVFVIAESNIKYPEYIKIENNTYLLFNSKDEELNENDQKLTETSEGQVGQFILYKKSSQQNKKEQ